jgi:hypothetical protein
MKKVVETWGKYFGYTLFVSMATLGKSPFDYSAADWKGLANAVWLALLPVVIKALNPKDASFGVKGK